VSYRICVIAMLCVCLAGCGSSRTASNLNSSTNPSNPASLNTSTTVADQTENNSSAANNFASQSNGNIGANNVSKVNVHSLLYPGATTKVLAHMMLWFGQSDHMNVGYTSNDAGQVRRQIQDMISRGIDGVVMDWYGPNNSIDQAAQLVMHEAEKHSGFSFSIMIDAGAMGSNWCNGCSAEDVLGNLLQYVEKTYFPSSAYLNLGGQPIVTNFDIDSKYSPNWQKVNSQLKVAPRFFFQDDGGFSHPMSDGSYSWVMPETGNFGLDYLWNFYSVGIGFGKEETVGAAYKGFNDTLAGWSSNRVMDQRCGKTWLQTFSQINSLYNQGRQLPYLQLVTWNDYEEGTEIESGIDSCFSLQASVTANTLNWSTAGDEDNIDNYTIYSSTDGQNLMKLTYVKPGTRSVDLCSLGISKGEQQLYVQAVGKPSMANRMPAPVNYTPSCGN